MNTYIMPLFSSSFITYSTFTGSPPITYELLDINKF